jgi:hypothetical protein
VYAQTSLHLLVGTGWGANWDPSRKSQRVNSLLFGILKRSVPGRGVFSLVR